MTEDQKIRACPAGSRNSNGRKLAESGRKEPSPHMVAAKIAFDSFDRLDDQRGVLPLLDKTSSLMTFIRSPPAPAGRRGFSPLRMHR